MGMYQAWSERQNISTENNKKEQNKSAKNALPDAYRECLFSEQ